MHATAKRWNKEAFECEVAQDTEAESWASYHLLPGIDLSLPNKMRRTPVPSATSSSDPAPDAEMS